MHCSCAVSSLGHSLRAAGLAHRIRRVDHRGLISLPFFERSGSVHAARLKQHGRRFPLCILEMLTSMRRWRVSGFRVAFTHRTRSQRAYCDREIPRTPFIYKRRDGSSKQLQAELANMLAGMTPSEGHRLGSLNMDISVTVPRFGGPEHS